MEVATESWRGREGVMAVWATGREALPVWSLVWVWLVAGAAGRARDERTWANQGVVGMSDQFERNCCDDFGVEQVL